MPTIVNFINNVHNTQPSVSTDYGTFKQEFLGPVWVEDPADHDVQVNFPVGVNMYMTFNADKNKISDAKEFGFIQQAKAKSGSSPTQMQDIYSSTKRKEYQDSSGAFIDQNPGLKNPLYATDKKTKPGGKRDIAGYKTQENPIRSPEKESDDDLYGYMKGRTHVGHGAFGMGYKENGNEHYTPASFQDTPYSIAYKSFNELTYDFETAILVFSGNSSGMYLGSVNWGFSVHKDMIQNPNSASANDKVAQGTINSNGITKASDGKPTPAFMESIRAWNKSKSASGRHKIIEAPTGSAKVKSDNSFLFASESDVEGKHKLLSKDAGCMIFEKKKLGDAQAEFARVRVDQGGKIMIGWVPVASLDIVQDV